MSFGFRIGLLALAVLAIFGFGWTTGNHHGFANGYADGKTWQLNADQEVMNEQRRIAKALYDKAAADNAALARDYDALKAQWKTDHDQATRDLDALRTSTAARIKQLGGLRDPGTHFGSGDGRPGSATAGAAVPAVGDRLPAQAGRVLSDETQQFLLDLAYDADRDAEVAAQCHAAATATN